MNVFNECNEKITSLLHSYCIIAIYCDGSYLSILMVFIVSIRTTKAKLTKPNLIKPALTQPYLTETNKANLT